MQALLAGIDLTLQLTFHGGLTVRQINQRFETGPLPSPLPLVVPVIVVLTSCLKPDGHTSPPDIATKRGTRITELVPKPADNAKLGGHMIRRAFTIDTYPGNAVACGSGEHARQEEQPAHLLPAPGPNWRSGC
eukprot:scaffold16684_cov42-Phaeocystis_antarctica.AAC.1